MASIVATKIQVSSMCFDQTKKSGQVPPQHAHAQSVSHAHAPLN